MKIAVIGANGRAGSRIVNEAVEKGHNVIRISRNGEGEINKDAFKLTSSDLEGIDVLISAFATWEDQSLHLKIAKHLDTITLEADIPWYTVGGAGSLYVDKDTQLFKTESFPESYYEVAKGMNVGYEYLKDQGQSKWSYFSPSAIFEPGERTGKYKFGGNNVMADLAGVSRISMEDYAVAMIDAVEKGAFVRERFTAVQQ